MQTLRNILSALSLAMLIIPAQAQLISPLNDYVQKARIGLVDEFFDRFNNAISVSDKVPDCIDRLMMLTDLSTMKSRVDPRFLTARAMMETAVDSAVHLNYSDTTWHALAHCRGVLDGKTVNFNLFLGVEQRHEADLYKWVVKRAEGSVFSLKPAHPDKEVMLMPDDHETNFMSLHRMTAESWTDMPQFLNRGFQPDATTLFTEWVQSDRLKIDYVEKLEFVFTQIPGYVFHIGYFERETGNSGWLITQFYEVSNNEEKQFLNEQRYFSDIVNTAETEIQETTPLQNGDAILQKVDSLRLTMLYRSGERVAQMNDYIAFMCSKEKDKEIRQYYASRLRTLFAPQTAITINDKTRNTTMRATPDSLTQILIESGIRVNVVVDSVALPIWNNILATASPDSVVMQLPAGFFKIVDGTIGIENLMAADGLAGYVLREETEDGFEWVPMLGNATITIDKRRK